VSGAVVIKRGREKPIVNQHPWIFSGAIDRVEGNPTPGDIVTVKGQDGRFLARGYWNPKSQIQVRILTWQDETIDEDWWRRMLRRAIERRIWGKWEFPNNIDRYCRLVNAENDYIPGLIIDRYQDWAVIQALTLGIDLRKKALATEVGKLLHLKGVYERSDVDVRSKEGLEAEVDIIWGEEPPEYITVDESSVKFQVDLRRGHKTGFYLDQRRNRWLLFEVVSSQPVGHRSMLNLFSYTGGFALHALVAGAEVAVSIDSSLEALELAEQSVKLNPTTIPSPEKAEFIQADVFEYIRDTVERNEQYDVIVCDPPKFAHNAQQVERAARGYKDLNLHCFKLIKPGGYLMTFSCSGAISADLFQKIVFGALADSGRQAQILRHLGPGDDHPVALTFPEGAYLKGLLLRVY
jgi:23S rRNA (cytosine1962-C5)-methyltransferase